MQMQNYDIVGSYNAQRVSNIDSERTVNMFEYIDPLGKKPKTLINTSGLEKVVNAQFPNNTGGFRRQFVFKDKYYSVVGSKVYSGDSANNQVELGTIGTPSGYVGIDANINQVIFVDGVNGYIHDVSTNLLQQITDPAFPPQPIDVAFLDGFFVVPLGGTNQFRLSSLNNGLIWGGVTNTFTVVGPPTDLLIISGGTASYVTGLPVEVSTSGTFPSSIPPLTALTTYYVIVVDATHIKLAATLADAYAGHGKTFTTAGTGTQTISNNGELQEGQISSHPGNIVACRTLHRRLFLFSEYYTEVWENAGIGFNLPFRRNNSLLMEYGCASRASVAVGFDRMFFLSQDRDGLGAVMQVLGTESVPVTTRAIDFQFAQYAFDQKITQNDPSGFLIKENGLIFYRLNFTAANHTWVFNVTMSTMEGLLWHEEETLVGNRHPAQTHVFFNGKNYVGNYQSPILYVIDNDLITNDGEAIRRMRIGRPYVPEGYNRIRVDRFHLDLLQGNVDIEILEEQFLATETTVIDILTESDEEIATEIGFVVVSSGQPEVFLSISKDGGASYGNQIKSPMGKIGERTFRTVWRKLGTIPRGQAFVPRFQFFNMVPFIILGGAWAIEVLPE